MKDVAVKLKGWKQTNIQYADILHLVRIQLNLQKFLWKQSQGKHGKQFYNYDTQHTQKQKRQWTSRNVLRIFDQLTQRIDWMEVIDGTNEDKILYDGDRYIRRIQNLVFQLIDAMHFVFNICLIHKIRPINFVQIYKTIQGQKKLALIKKKQKVRVQRLLDVCFSKTSRLLATYTWKHWKNFKDADTRSMKKRLDGLLISIIRIAQRFNYTAQDVYKMYLRKNKQNHKRQIQMQGYKN